MEQQQKRSTPEQSMDVLVGPVSETREQHMERHGKGGHPKCPRCKYYKFGEKWAKAYGSIELQHPRKSVRWLAEKPLRFGGTWGLGCVFCADMRARLNVADAPPDRQHQNNTRSRRFGSAWARFDVRPRALQAEHTKQHAHYDVHKISTKAYLRPDEASTTDLQVSAEDDALLSGAVPQLADWLRAWRAARTPQSWQAAAQAQQTEHYIHQLRARSVTSRGLQQMAEVMRSMGRAKKQQWIRDCSAISLAFDDRKGYKLIRFRCDVSPFAPPQGKNDPPGDAEWSRDGIVGCVECLQGVTLQDMAEDYGERTSREVLNVMQAFCAVDGVLDEALFKKFCAATRSLVVDGALLKTCHMLKLRSLPNVQLILRDPAHAIRIAVKEPLCRTGLRRRRSASHSSELQGSVRDCTRAHLC